MKIDMHTHYKKASNCAHHEPELLPAFFKDKGVDAIVLTNHCYPWHCKGLGETLDEQAFAYVETYRRCKAEGDKVGIKVFFGVELKLVKESNCPGFLLYVRIIGFMSNKKLMKKINSRCMEGVFL